MAGRQLASRCADADLVGRPAGLLRWGEVEAGDGHERAGHGLVTTAESDDGVRKVSLVHDLDAVGDGVPGDERVPHGLGAVRQTVTERDILLSGLTVEGFISALSVYST